MYKREQERVFLDRYIKRLEDLPGFNYAFRFDDLYRAYRENVEIGYIPQNDIEMADYIRSSKETVRLFVKNRGYLSPRKNQQYVNIEKARSVALAKVRQNNLNREARTIVQILNECRESIKKMEEVEGQLCIAPVCGFADETISVEDIHFIVDNESVDSVLENMCDETEELMFGTN